MSINPRLRCCLDILIADEKHARNQIIKLNGEIKLLSSEERFRKKIACLRSVPGVGILTAITFMTELVNPGRFDDAG